MSISDTRCLLKYSYNLDHHEPGFERGKTSKRNKRSSAVNDAPITGTSVDSSSPGFYNSSILSF